MSIWKLAGIAAALTLAATAARAELPRQHFSVVGTWGNLTNWLELERPFWQERIPEASDGQITAAALPQTELGLRGPEIMRMLSRGIYHFAHALPIYVAEDAALEGLDLAGVARDFETARQVAEAYAPMMEEPLLRNYNARALAYYSFPAQMIYCKEPIGGLQDLRGKRVRVQGASQGDLVEAFGGVAVTLAFAEVVPALQRGVVDCGITGTMPAYKSGWHEVVTHVLELPVGFTIAFLAVNERTWSELDEATRELISTEAREWEDEAWRVIQAENEMGLICSTGVGGECTEGVPGSITRVQPTEADIQLLERALNDVVLSRWAARCGLECAQRWNESVGEVTDLTASAS